MGKVVFLSLSVFVLAACNNPKSGSSESTDEQTTENTAIDGDKDEHGCLVGAGETWSELKQSCVHIRLADKYGIKLPFDVPAENCMAIELIEGALRNVHGVVEYPQEFNG